MTDRTQFEAMLEALINEDQETAKEIFHNIVVAKSREIYEELLSEDFDVREESEEEEESVEEGENPFAGAEEEEGEEEEGEEEGEEEESGDDVSGDATDDFIGDVEDDAEGEEADGELEDRVLDLEDALDELKAEFEELLSQEADEEGHDMAAIDAADGETGDDEFGGDMGAGMGGEEEFDELAGLMEYVNKVNPPKHGDNGANTKSIVAGKNDMGGTTANIVKGGTSTTGGTQGGLLKPSTQEDNAGNVNVPGNSKAPKLNTVAAGHGAEKKGKGESADNKRSIVGGK